jgi:hypothetical protein
MVADSLTNLDSRFRGNDGLMQALLVAESNPKNKDVFIRLVMNMLAGAGNA